MNTALSPSASLSLEDLCRACSVTSVFVLEMVQEGALNPTPSEVPERWRFTEIEVRHITVAARLQRDLGVNPAGAALALQLLDEVETLRAQLAVQAAAPDDLG